jgi:hypothetical protein
MLPALAAPAAAVLPARTVLQAVLERMQAHVCPLLELPAPCAGIMQRVAARLAATRLVVADGVHIKSLIMLNVARDDVAETIRQDGALARLHQLL